MFHFLGIGAQKSGTTWLFEMLKQHPDIQFPMNKEVHFWNRKINTMSTENYFANFNQDNVIEGEITPAYAFLPKKTISLLHDYKPETRLILIIRNPIDRAWSSAKMALTRAEMTFEEASDQWFIDHFNSQGSLLRGDYQTCISNWRSVFDDDQLLVLNFDDIRLDPQQLLECCCDHLEITHFTSQQLTEMKINQIVFSSSKQVLNRNLRSHLRELYIAKINALENYLSTDLSNWK